MVDQGITEPGVPLPARRGNGWIGRVAAPAWASAANLLRRLAAVFERERDLGRAFLWIPVLFGAGIAAYFGLPREPAALPLVAATAVVAVLAIWRRDRIWSLRLLVALAAVLGGLTYMKVRTDLGATPVIAREMTGELTGWVESVERFAPNNHRLVIRVATIEDLAPQDTPGRVRITVRGAFEVTVGDGISGLVGLQPPASPVMPGGYDFGRELFYEGIGGSGFSYGPPDIVDLGPPLFSVAWRVPIAAVRDAIGARIEAAMPDENGQIATALITGDRGGISDEANRDLRISGLAHVLSISGLHMALVAGSTFFVLRALLALWPALALRRPIKKWAAAGALLVATAYFALSGAEVPTVRSYIMLLIALGAVMLDRRAFSVRNVALAATIVLLLYPASILTPGFQMSFAATLALAAGFEVFTERRRARLALGPGAGRSPIRWVLIAVSGLILTSLLAGLATAPFGAWHFQRTSPFSLLANVAAAPVITMVVMWPAMLAVVAMPFGLEQAPLAVMDFGLDVMLGIAATVADWTGDGGMVSAAPAIVLVLFSLGIVWLCAWKQRWRWWGAAPLVVATAIWALAVRPDIIVDETGTIAAVRGEDGRYRVLGDGGDFEVETWLRGDGDTRLAGDGTLDDDVFCDRLGCTTRLADGRIVALSDNPRAFVEDCAAAAVIVTALDRPADCADAVVADAGVLRVTGAQAIYVESDGRLRTVATRPVERRPWMPPLAPQ